MFNSFINFLKDSKSNTEIKLDENVTIVGGILLEAAAVDGNIDKNEVLKIKSSLINFFNITEAESNNIVKECLDKVDEPNSFYYFTSKINKNFEYSDKVKIIEILWEIILIDQKVHDFESNLIRRLSGLFYISDVDCGNAKKRAETKLRKEI